ncbi:hypothetical protein ACF0H5_002801 [Mactra antiquata]
MNRITLFLYIIVFVFTCGICTGCMFGVDCEWNIRNGFELINATQLEAIVCQQSLDCPELADVREPALLLQGEKNGSIRREMIHSNFPNNTVCVDIWLYSRKSTAVINLSLQTNNDKTSMKHIKIDSTKSGLQKHTLRHRLPSGRKSNITLLLNVDKTAGMVMVINVTFAQHCEPDDVSSSCPIPDDFQCKPGVCINWRNVCDLKRDCTNGKDEQICDNLPQPALCTFEDGTCGWTDIMHFKGFTWHREQGPKPPIGTGPEIDHTLGTKKGHYMYISGGDGTFIEFATLQSVVMPSIHEKFADRCQLRFFYHMVGREVQKLEVTQTEVCSNDTKTLHWSKEGQQGRNWKFAEINIKPTLRYIIRFRAYGAFLQHGDIAVDDVSFSPGCFGYNIKGYTLIDTETHLNHLSVEEFINDTRRHCDPDIDDPVTSSSAVYTTKQHPEKLSVPLIIAITLSAVVVSIVMGTALLCLAIRRRKTNNGPTARLEMVSTVSDDNNDVAPVQSSSIDMQLRCAVTELNPNYDFITAKYPEQQLREIPRNKLTLTRLLGQGAFGEVYEGSLKNLCANVKELPVAVKTLPALSMDQAEKDFLMEAVIISKFMHKNVVKCLGVCFEEHPRYIILELLEGGDLRTFLRDSRTKGDHACTLSMEELLKLALDIANGCRHLEEKHFVHRDVAARNCLLTSRGPERIAKIADFGMSRDIYSSDYYRKGGKAMLPIKWMPPEAFLDGVFTSKTDTWSYGVLLWEIFTLGYMPYPGQTNSDVMHFVASGGRLDPPDKCPARLSKIMIMCWNSVADIRPSFSEIIELLDMCLQDDEVLNANVSLCHYPMSDCFKDASTLAKAASITENVEDSAESMSCDTTASAAGFQDHFESQSREPLLLSSPDS